jgi:uncharacterized repeat protein (TIGR03803 family)
MNYKKFSAAASAALMIIAVVILALAPSVSAASNYKVLYKFTGGADGNEFMEVTGEGNWFSSGLVFDAAGNLYGATAAGGAYGYGVIFKLVPNTDGTWTESVLYSFTGGPDGAYPFAGPIFDSAGNLYGTTSGGGFGSCSNAYTKGCGVVFELAPNLDGSWTESVLYSFTGGADGAQPEARLTFDTAGNLYGTTDAGGLHLSGPCPYNPFGYNYDNGCGVAFQLTPNSDGSWTESVLHRFTGGWDGGTEIGPLIFDAAGNLYGTAQGGKYVQGVVFKLTLAAGSWKETILHAFTYRNEDGADPLSFTGLVFDSAGNLYGTAFWIPTFGGGEVFKLTPTSSGPWKWSVVHSFGPANMNHPVAGVILDSAGNIYGTTVSGGVGDGIVFKVTPKSGGGWKYAVLHIFMNNPLSCPFSLILDPRGNMYGTSCYSDVGAGGAFEITP